MRYPRRNRSFHQTARAGLVLLGLMVLAAPAAHACSCIEPPPAPERAAESTATFLARVESTRLEENRRIYQLTVVESFTGDWADEVNVSTPTNGAMCGVRLTLGAEYLIFCYGEPNQLRTNLCSANRLADSDAGRNDLAALRARSPTGNE